jgi:hypothetical protein
MRLYGYQEGSDADEPLALGEVTFATSPLTLRQLAEFFLHVATEMERHGSAFGHEHFGDYNSAMRAAPGVIVVRESNGSG